MVPVERDRLALAEQAPRPVVPPGAVPVERGGHGERQHPDARHHGGADRGLAARHARQPQPGAHQEEEHETAQRRRTRVVLGHRGAVQDQQGRESGYAQRPGGPARRPEGQRGRDGEERRHAEQDAQPDPGVGAVVGPLDLLHAGEATVEAVRELAPVSREQQAPGKARRHQPKRKHRQRDHGGQRVQCRPRERGSPEQPERSGAAGGHQDDEERPADGWVLHQKTPVRRAEGAEGGEGDQPHGERVAHDGRGRARAAGGGGRSACRGRLPGCGRARRSCRAPASGGAPRPLDEAAGAAGHLERGPHSEQHAGRDHIARPGGQPLEGPRGGAKVGSGHPDHRAAARAEHAAGRRRLPPRRARGARARRARTRGHG